jgi:hypothetical protein
MAEQQGTEEGRLSEHDGSIKRKMYEAAYNGLNVTEGRRATEKAKL